MQSGYRSVDYQTKLYNNKTQYYRDQGCSEADARAKAATIVNPPGYSEHATGLAADLNTPEHTSLDEGFENTASSCGIPRMPKPSPRSPTSRGTGAMWGRKTPPLSARAACALRMPLPFCRSWPPGSPSQVKNV